MASAYKATGINNLDFHVETETYYARLKQNGNTIRQAVRRIFLVYGGAAGENSTRLPEHWRRARLLPEFPSVQSDGRSHKMSDPKV